MRRRPWALVILAILHFLAPIGNIAFNAFISNKNIAGYFVYAMSPEYLIRNWVIIVAPIVAGAAIYACKKWSFYIYLLSIFILFIFSYSGYISKSDSISILPVLFVYLVNILVVGYFLIPAVRNVFFDRRLRWWEIQARYKCDFNCSYMAKQGGNSFEGKVGNISENGLFLKADVHPKDKSIVEITVKTFADPLVINGEVILHNRVDAVGFGVKFQHTEESKRLAKELVIELEKRGMRISTLDLRPEDSFSYWLRNLIKTGRGLLPKKER